MTSKLSDRLQNALGENYVIERELPGGGMSHVFLAEDRRLGRKVVIKVLRPDLAASISSERFAREIKVSAQLQHPQIVALLTAGDTDGLPYYVMPYVEGEGLRERITREGKLPIRDVVAILRDVAKALAFAHSKNVVHRDIKPENVLINGRLCGRRGLWNRESYWRGTDARWLAGITQFDIGRDHSGDAGLHGPRAGNGRPQHGSSRRHLFLWLRRIRDAYRPRPIRTQDRSSRRFRANRRSAEAGERLSPRLPTISRVTGDALPGEVSGQAPANGSRADQGTRRGEYRSLERLGAFAPRTENSAHCRRGAGHRVGGIRYRALSQSDTPSPAIAVLPFKNLGGDSTGVYFGEGIAEELALTLRKLPGVQVASQTSAAAVQNKGMTIQDMGKALGVGTVLEGSVQRDGEHLRLNATLSDATDGRVIWTDDFDRDAKDLFGVQNDLVQAIVRALEVRLTDAARPSAVRGTADAAAYDYYLRGRYAITRGVRDSRAMPSAVTFFEQAIGRDSTFARAYAGYADAISLLPFFTGAPFDSVTPLMFSAARKAIALDPLLGEAHASLARAYSYENSRDSAEREYKVSLKLDPTYAAAEQWLSSILCGEGRLAECLVHSQRAAELDPMNTVVTQYYANSLMLMGHSADADSAYQRAIQLDSTVVITEVSRALMLDLGHYQEMISLREKYKSPWGEVVYALAKLGRRARADSVLKLNQARNRSPDTRSRRSLGDEVLAYIGVGDTTRALDALDRETGRFIRQPGRSLSDPLFDPIRMSPRFAAYVQRLGLDPKILATGKGGRP